MNGARGWKLDRGWLVRTRTKTGAEGKQKFPTYQEAKEEALRLETTREFKEIWVDEADIVVRAFRDLGRTSSRVMENRQHVLSIEDND